MSVLLDVMYNTSIHKSNLKVLLILSNEDQFLLMVKGQGNVHTVFQIDAAYLRDTRG